MTTDVLDCNLKEIVSEVFQKENDSLETVTTRIAEWRMDWKGKAKGERNQGKGHSHNYDRTWQGVRHGEDWGNWKDRMKVKNFQEWVHWDFVTDGLSRTEKSNKIPNFPGRLVKLTYTQGKGGTCLRGKTISSVWCSYLEVLTGYQTWDIHRQLEIWAKSCQERSGLKVDHCWSSAQGWEKRQEAE